MKEVTQVLAECVRVEIDSKTDELYLVFKITDEKFKKTVKDDWLANIEVKLLGKNLVESK